MSMVPKWRVMSARSVAEVRCLQRGGQMPAVGDQRADEGEEAPGAAGSGRSWYGGRGGHERNKNTRRRPVSRNTFPVIGKMSRQVKRDRPVAKANRSASFSTVEGSERKVVVTEAMAGVEAMSGYYLDLTSSRPGDLFERAVVRTYFWRCARYSFTN